MARSFPHLIYFGMRGRIELNQLHTGPSDESSGENTESRLALRRILPWSVDLTGWVRVTIPPREDLELSLDQSVYPPGLLTIATEQRTAVAVAFGVRELWPRLIVAEELLYESPRTDQAAVSPGNLEGNKLDLSLATRVRLHRRLWLLLTAGVTEVFFGPNAGSGFSTSAAANCRMSGYDITTYACQQVEFGWGVPTAAGNYWLVVPHGSAGLEVNL
jgi:hypothetical protein